MKVLYHLGLGDAIATAAIIQKLSEENGHVEIPCWRKNWLSVKSLFGFNGNVLVKKFDSEWEVLSWGKDADLRLGHYKHEDPQKDNEDFVQWFYRQAGLNISEKAKYCPIANAAIQFPFYRWGVLKDGRHTYDINLFMYHDDASRGFVIPNKKGKPNYDQCTINMNHYKDETILQWHDLIKNAKEIHCIDSSVLHLVECLPTNAKLFYHKYARPHSTDYKHFTKNWEIIK